MPVSKSWNVGRYFYEPFLAAFDPELRKQMGVCTPRAKSSRYMVERVDQVLRSELGLRGWAGRSVGFGFWTRAAARVRIWWRCWLLHRLDAEGKRARTRLTADDLKQAAMTRVAGFEIMAAPLCDRTLAGGTCAAAPRACRLAQEERAAVYLPLNALTGWAALPEDQASVATQSGILFHLSAAGGRARRGARLSRSRMARSNNERRVSTRMPCGETFLIWSETTP